MQGRLRENGLEEAWVYGLMRQESRFANKAKSDVGAAGLMQIMPATAKWVARKMGMRDYRSALIHETDVNLKLGTYYMKNVLSSFDNNAVLASAAYNAGPARARQWRGEKALEGAIYVETIPFDETREYVKKVMSNTVYYSKLFDQPSVSLKQRLGIIAGKTTENQKPIPDEHLVKNLLCRWRSTRPITRPAGKRSRLGCGGEYARTNGSTRLQTGRQRFPGISSS